MYPHAIETKKHLLEGYNPFTHYHLLKDSLARLSTAGIYGVDAFFRYFTFQIVTLLFFQLFENILQRFVFLYGEHVFHFLTAEFRPDDNGLCSWLGGAFHRGYFIL